MDKRARASDEIARLGGALALDYFNRAGSLTIEDKGPQDFVSEADRAVEQHIRDAIFCSFPEDGVVGEEFEDKPSTSGFTWVIDPIDGTANFIAGIPCWTVVLAIVFDDRTQIGAIFDPVHEEMYHAIRGAGARLNGRPLKCPTDRSLSRGSVGVGYSAGLPGHQTAAAVSQIVSQGGVFYRNASGATSLAYVAAGRLIGYIQGHMHAWDCMAGQLLIAEAGGMIEDQSAASMITNGGRVIASGRGVFGDLEKIANEVFASP